MKRPSAASSPAFSARAEKTALLGRSPHRPGLAAVPPGRSGQVRGACGPLLMPHPCAAARPPARLRRPGPRKRPRPCKKIVKGRETDPRPVPFNEADAHNRVCSAGRKRQYGGEFRARNRATRAFSPFPEPCAPRCQAPHFSYMIVGGRATRRSLTVRIAYAGHARGMARSFGAGFRERGKRPLR